jgi:tetratricopeptide (TPR) repeat protein
MRIYTCFFLIVFFIACKEKEAKKMDALGIVEFKVTGNSEAKDHFEKGLLLLHSFEYEDAREAFLIAQKTDPTMSMAYWGEAMTYNHALWGEQDYDEGITAIEKINAFGKLDKATEIERRLIDAVKILYTPKTPKKERDEAYKEYMKSLHDTYPDNDELAAFYSISLLGSVPEGRNDSIFGLGADVAKQVLNKNPEHPGALHYLIHSYDDPYHAHLAIDAANAYSKVAPDASHALHMPSHIYVALGMWDEVINSNIDSYQASLNRMKRKGLDNDARGYHAYHWLQYGYLQKGNIKEAEKMVLDMEQYAKETPSDRSKVHLVYLKGTYLVESNNWQSYIADIDVDVSSLNLRVQSQYYFIEGYKAFVNEKSKTLDSIIHVVENNIEKESLLVDNISSGFTVCSSVSRSTPTQTSLDASIVMLKQLKALKYWLEDNHKETESFLIESVADEQKLSYSYGPPVIQKPTNELYAEWLMSKNRYSEAIEQYNLTLERATDRKLSVEGKEKAIQLNDKRLAVD